MNYFIKHDYYYDTSGTVQITIRKKTIPECYHDGVTVEELRRDPNYTLDEIDNPKLYSIIELLEGGYSLQELKQLGYNACQIFATKRYTMQEIERAGYRIRYCIG